MKFIVITSPVFIPGEATLVTTLFDCGIDALHLRKPEATEEECAALVNDIPEAYRRQIVVHDHFRLCRDYRLMGIHINSRNPQPPAGLRYGSLSASCHSVAEVAGRKKHCDYVFMSPVFDSISKRGYGAAYSRSELDEAAAKGIIDSRVMALGGVSLENIGQLRRWRFGGAAFLGDVWNRACDSDFAHHIRKLRNELDKDTRY